MKIYYYNRADVEILRLNLSISEVLMSVSGMKFAFLGCGNIANAIIGGLLEKQLVSSSDIFVYDVNSEKYKSDIMLRVNCCSTLKEAVSAADIVVFAIKPSVVSLVAKQIADEVDGYLCKMYISVAAAVPTDYICECLGYEVPVIRAMPNTPLMVGEGAVAISRNRLVTDKLFSYICRLFSGISVISVIDESLMDSIVSVNGSSPAYVYLFFKSMIDAAIELGVPQDKATPLVLQSIKGALAMLQRSGKDADTLIRDVSSPGGTTLAALSVLNDNGFSTIVRDAMFACSERSKEMSKEITNGR